MGHRIPTPTPGEYTVTTTVDNTNGTIVTVTESVTVTGGPGGAVSAKKLTKLVGHSPVKVSGTGWGVHGDTTVTVYQLRQHHLHPGGMRLRQLGACDAPYRQKGRNLQERCHRCGRRGHRLRRGHLRLRHFTLVLHRRRGQHRGFDGHCGTRLHCPELHGPRCRRNTRQRCRCAQSGGHTGRRLGCGPGVRCECGRALHGRHPLRQCHRDHRNSDSEGQGDLQLDRGDYSHRR